MSPPLEFEMITLTNWRVMRRRDIGSVQIGSIHKDTFGSWRYLYHQSALREHAGLTSIDLDDIASKIRELEELEA